MGSPSNTLITDKVSILYITLGCAKNEVDTDRMRSILNAYGYEEAQNVSSADIAIVNTCSFLVSATEESIELTLSLAEEAKEGVRKLPIIMCGCVPSRYGSELIDELPEVAAFVRHDEEDSIAEVVAHVLNSDSYKSQNLLTATLRTVEGTSAYIKISEGCDRFCSFCAIPLIRGSYYSRTPDVILKEVLSLVEQGVKEFVLIGQDTGIWGYDLEEPKTLAWLLSQVANVIRPFNGWVRVLYLQPEGMTDELITTIRDTKEIIPYIDIPIQHCSKDVLKRMNRSGSVDELRLLFAKLKQEIPNMVLRTTAMAGFPGETDAEADELVSFLQEVAFDYCSVFAYSREEGTLAAEFPNQIDEETKIERTQTLIDVSERLGFAATAAHVGEIVDVIIDGVEESDSGFELIGHTWFQAPDSDGVVHLGDGNAAVGDIVKARLVDSFCYELIGEIIT